MTDFEKFISEGGDTLEGAPTKNDNTEKFPCGQCAGTGNWRGGTNRNGEKKCFACRGTGFFKTDPRKLAQNRVAAKARKVKKAAAAAAAFDTANPEIAAFLKDASSWSDFAASLLAGGRKYGSLSEKQMNAAKSMMAKVAANATKKKADTPPAAEVDLTPIREMFERAFAKGHKRPTYRAEGLVISRAPDHGANAGALYVKAGEDYQGKVIGTAFSKVRDTLETTAPALTVIANDPEAAAIRYGRLTGSCACCGRELTNAESIELGIGPICRAKWF